MINKQAAIMKKKRSQLLRLIDLGMRMAMGSRLTKNTVTSEYQVCERTFFRDMNILSGIMPIISDDRHQWRLLKNMKGGVS